MGGVVGLIGIFTKDVNLGLRLEGAGHVAMAGGCAIYALALIVWIDHPWWPQPTVWWAFLLALASAVRWAQIVYVIHKAHKKSEGAK